jgi:hypothetical protein
VVDSTHKTLTEVVDLIVDLAHRAAAVPAAAPR